MKNRMLSLPSMLCLLAFGMVFSISAKPAHADEFANQPSQIADEATTVVRPSQDLGEQSQPQAEEASPAKEEETSNLSLKPQNQQDSENSESSTEAQDPIEQTPPESVSQAPASETTSVETLADPQTQTASQNQSSNTDKNDGPGVIRATSAQLTATRSVLSSQTGDAIVDLSADKASYRLGEDVNLSVDFKNTTDKEQDITVYADVYYVDNKLGTYKFSKHLKAGEGYKMQAGDLKIPGSQFENNHGYLLKIKVADADNNTLSQVNKAIAVESDWTKFPRYGIVGGSQDTSNSLLSKDADRYRAEIEKMKNMNINSYFFYDVYKTATNPFPSDEATFKQDWNTWSGSEIDTQAVKDIVNQVHDGGAVAMLYNMILAENTNTGEAPALPETEYAYNSDDRGYGAQGQPMSYTVKIPKDGQEEEVQIQRYYNPTSKLWQDYIADKMGQAMKNGGFDGWQGDTIGDNEVYDYADKDSDDPSKKHWLTEGYAEFLRAIKEKLPNYYLTVNDVNGEQIYRLKDGNQDVTYNEIWPFGGSALGDGRSQTEYGDLKARVDEVRKVTGKSLIVGAYMEGSEKGGSKDDAEAGKALQTDAVLLTSASIAAAGGYHMSLAALANQQDESDGGQGIGVLQTAYYPTQSLKTSSELTRKNNDYQQFITAYENILRDGVENDDAQVNTYNSEGQLLSTDAKGINGHQVWTYGKKGDNFRTVQLLNLMGINSDWKNEDGSAANKTPDEQTNLTVRYALGDVSMEDARRMANQTYVTSPDDWSKSNLQKVSASVKTDENGKPVLVINVPKLTLWDVVYISNADHKSTPQAEQTGTPAAQAGDDKTSQNQASNAQADQNQASQPAQEEAKAQEQSAPVDQVQAGDKAQAPVAQENSSKEEVAQPAQGQATPQAETATPAAQAASPSQPTNRQENQAPAGDQVPKAPGNSEQAGSNGPVAQEGSNKEDVAPTAQGQASPQADSPAKQAEPTQSGQETGAPSSSEQDKAQAETGVPRPQAQAVAPTKQAQPEAQVSPAPSESTKTPEASAPSQPASPEQASGQSDQTPANSKPSPEPSTPANPEQEGDADKGQASAPEADQPTTPENTGQNAKASDADKNKSNEAGPNLDPNKSDQNSGKDPSTDNSGNSATPDKEPGNSGQEPLEPQPLDPNADTNKQEQTEPVLPLVPDPTPDVKKEKADTPEESDPAKDKKSAADANKDKASMETEDQQKPAELPKEATELEKVGQPASPQISSVQESVSSKTDKKMRPVLKNTKTSSDKLPKTGDHKTVGLIILLGLAFVGTTGLLAKRERK